MRVHTTRWYAPLLSRSMGTTLFVRKLFPEAVFKLEKRHSSSGKMTRHIHFSLDGKIIVFARSEVDLEKSNPKIISLLKKTNKPIGELVKLFRVRRTRLRSTTRSREFHFTGDLHARIVERFYNLPMTREKIK